MVTTTLSQRDYTVGWICVLPIEMAAAKVMLDEIHGDLSVPFREINTYILGALGKHNIVITCPAGMGNISAAGAVVRLLDSFPSIRFGLLVGIGGGIPNSKADIRLGDVVVSKPTGTYGGVVQYGFGKAVEGGLEPVGSLPQPSPVLLAAMNKLEAFHLTEESRIPEFLHEMEKKLGPKKALKFTRPLQEDRLFQPTYSHIKGANTCDSCETTKIVQRTAREIDEPGIHYGLIASGNVVVKDSNFRDRIKEDHNCTPYCVEMEAAGVMNYLPCLVIRGICDYADSHKNDAWQGYAAAVAAAFSKELLTMVDDENMAIARLSGFVNFCIPFDLSNIPVIHRFMGRDDDLNRLWDLLQPANPVERKVVVLHGLGGIGKTQLAVHFAKQYKSDFSAIFWLNGKSRETLFRSLAGFLPKLPTTDNTDTRKTQVIVDLKTEEEIKKAAKQVLEWLDVPSNTKWLLIFDNVDNFSTAENTDSCAYDVRKLFPSADHGSIIITSRAHHDLVREVGHSYPVQTLRSDEATALLRNCAGYTMENAEELPGFHQDITTLVQQLDGLPLAIVIAGTYMRETGTSVSEYLKSKSESWISLHKEEAARPDAYYSNGDLVTTWLVSYKEIQRRSPSAARLLLLLAFYDNQDIWYDLIHNALKNERETGPSWLFEVASSRAKFSRTIRYLLHFSFVQSKPYLSSYSLHPVVHDWCRAYIKGKDIEKEAMRIAIISVGFSCVFSHQREYWISQQRLLPHANRMFEFLKDNQSSFGDPIILNAVKYLGMLYRDQCKLGNAEQLLEWALTGGEAIGLDVTPVMNSLAVIYEQLGRLEQSEMMLRRALTGKDVLVLDDQIRLRVIDATTLNTVNSLGYLCRIRGKLHQAEMMFCQVLTGREELLGLDHPLTVAAMDNVASVYLDQGKLQQAEKLYEEALTRKRNLLGSDHPDTLITINNIGDLYLTQGKLEKAENMFQQALTGREKAVGPHRLNTTRTLNGLASLYQEQGRLEEAKEMFQRALVICEEVLGTNHPDTLTVISNLGVLYWKLGHLQQAEEMWKRALAGYEKVLGPDHHKTRQVVTALNLHCNKGPPPTTPAPLTMRSRMRDLFKRRPL